jgi:hypothetical protein
MLPFLYSVQDSLSCSNTAIFGTLRSLNPHRTESDLGTSVLEIGVHCVPFAAPIVGPVLLLLLSHCDEFVLVVAEKRQGSHTQQSSQAAIVRTLKNNRAVKILLVMTFSPHQLY